MRTPAPVTSRTWETSTYRDVRALGRGLMLLETLARTGWAKPGRLSAETGIDRSSVYRLLNTLVDLGFVARRSEDGAVALTRRVRHIADGVRDDDAFLETVGAHLAALVGKVKWPSDLAMLSGGIATIQDSTHSLSRVTFHRATIGQERSLLRSSLGRAILSMLNSDELEMVLEIVRQAGGPDERLLRNRAGITKMLNQIYRLGYAAAEGAVDPNVSAIAMGFRGSADIVGSVNIVFFRKVMSPTLAAERFLPQLQNCVKKIGDDLRRLPRGSTDPAL